MSEINKPCPFNPDQYKIDTLAAPVGTSPWALIQVYLGNKVHRKDWDAPDEYIHLIPGNGNDDAPEIKKRDKHGVMTAWQATQEDLMACDWKLLESAPTCPEGTMLSFELKSGTSTYDPDHQDWGYLADDEFSDLHEHPFGSLNITYNGTDIKKISLFYWENENSVYLKVSSDNNQEGHQKMVDLFSKDFTVTIGNVYYHLGSTTDDNSYMSKGEYEFLGLYENEDAQKLGALLKQNVGNKLNFCFTWK
ncbi:DUF2829 domain-containing protein [Xenorhabdus sp. 18]|uniref:Thoeris anti-defense Tad2 family protein n=1 Tax=Xenorhabdus doucetiae TaxID=351671 RepID=UPI0019838C99|nr:MW1434 family type I TA system toxin [Xenorhabdus sp. 18]MBD2798389.1 DUF2829 domain-containing protein [Xenorhabdus sp. 18]